MYPNAKSRSVFFVVLEEHTENRIELLYVCDVKGKTYLAAGEWRGVENVAVANRLQRKAAVYNAAMQVGCLGVALHSKAVRLLVIIVRMKFVDKLKHSGTSFSDIRMFLLSVNRTIAVWLAMFLGLTAHRLCGRLDRKR